MANQDHVAKLRSGINAWNSWRVQTRETPDFREADLREIDLERKGLANAHGANLTNAMLDGADLTGSCPSREIPQSYAEDRSSIWSGGFVELPIIAKP